MRRTLPLYVTRLTCISLIVTTWLHFGQCPLLGRLQPVTWNLNERLLYANADIQILPRVEITLTFANSTTPRSRDRPLYFAFLPVVVVEIQ
jgi:hypothetical protein